MSNISKENISVFVKEILDDTECNISYFPDAIEKAIYENVIFLTMKVLNKLIESSEVRFAGHKLTININPLSETTYKS